jgi:hypothetical protein
LVTVESSRSAPVLPWQANGQLAIGIGNALITASHFEIIKELLGTYKSHDRKCI